MKSSVLNFFSKIKKVCVGLRKNGGLKVTVATAE